MGILITVLHTGVVVDYDEKEGGRLIGHAGGHDIRIEGNAPAGYTLNQTLAMCLPHIVALTGAPAGSISYARLAPKPRAVKVSSKQRGLFDEPE